MQLKGKAQSIMGIIQWVVTQGAMEGIFKEGYLDQGTEGWTEAQNTTPRRNQGYPQLRRATS